MFLKEQRSFVLLGQTFQLQKLDFWLKVSKSKTSPSCTLRSYVCDAMCNLVAFVQLKRHKKHPWRSVDFSKVNTAPWVFFMFFKLYKCYQIAQRTYILSMYFNFIAYS